MQPAICQQFANKNTFIYVTRRNLSRACSRFHDHVASTFSDGRTTYNDPCSALQSVVAGVLPYLGFANPKNLEVQAASNLTTGFRVNSNQIKL